jgi:hypothetical protein
MARFRAPSRHIKCHRLPSRHHQQPAEKKAEVGTMKRKLAGILMCLLPLVGCNNDVQKPDKSESEKQVIIQTSHGPIVMKHVNRNDEQKELTASVQGSAFSATLRIVPAGDGVMTVGANAMLVDASGRLLYSIEMTVNQETNEVVYRQATEDDYVAWSVMGTDERVRESYDADGAKASFDYAQIPEAAKARTMNEVQHGMPISSLPVSVREYATQAEAFRAYYLPYANNSLTNNPNGEVLVQLLASPDASYALIGDQPEQMNRLAQAFCSLVTSCSTFLCRLLPGSGICSACTGAALACVIFETMGPWIWGIP